MWIKSEAHSGKATYIVSRIVDIVPNTMDVSFRAMDVNSRRMDGTPGTMHVVLHGKDAFLGRADDNIRAQFLSFLSKNTMKAIRIHEFGGPDVLRLEEIEKPVPADDEVLIRIFATSVNPVDSKIRSGKNYQRYHNPMPLTLGVDVSGMVEETGSSVTRFKKGDEVYAYADFKKDGSYAEYIKIQSGRVGFKPKTIGHNQSAAVPLASLTAWQGIFDHGKLQPGQRILIHAAAGGVGSFAVQLAKWKGAYVIGTASGDNLEFVKQLGADEVIDYKTQTFEDLLENIDVVFDLIGGDTQTRSIQILKEGGILVSTLGIFNKDLLAQKNIHGETYMTQSVLGQLTEIANLVDGGKLHPVIFKLLPLEQAAEAQRESEAGHVRGKIVLEIRSENE